MTEVETGTGNAKRSGTAWAAAQRIISWKRGVVALAIVALLSLALRLHISQACSLWLDEAATHSGVVKSWAKVLQGPSRGHPPLMYVLVKLAIGIFGQSETGVRAVSLFFGCVLLFAIYELCLELRLSIGRALIVVATFALAPFFIRHATEARHYALLMSFGTLAITRALRLLRRPSSAGDLIGFSVCVVAMPATHYFGLAYAAALLGCVSLGCAMGWKQAAGYQRWLLPSVLLICLVALSFLGLRAAQVGDAFGVGKANASGRHFVFNAELLREIPSEFSLLENDAWRLALEPALALLALVLLTRQLSGVARLLPLGLGAVPCVAALFMSTEHFISPRYLAPSAILYHLGACVALFALFDRVESAARQSGWKPWLAPVAGGIVLVGVVAVRLREHPHGFGVGTDDYRGLQRYFKDSLARDTALVAYPGLFGKFLFDDEYNVGQKSIALDDFRAAKGGRTRYLIAEIHSDTPERQAEIESLVEQIFRISPQSWRALPLVALPHSVYQPAVRARLVQVGSDWSPPEPKKRKHRRRKRRAPHVAQPNDDAPSDDAD